MRVSLPVQLVFVIIAATLFGGYLSTTAVSFFYTISILIKEFLSFILPVMVFAFVSSGVMSFKSKAPIVLFLLFAVMTLSNAAVGLLSYSVMKLLFPFISGHTIVNIAHTTTIEPLISLSLPSLIRSEFALIGAMLVGLILSIMELPFVVNGIGQLKSFVEQLLRHGIIPVLPLFVFGFLLKLQAEGMIGSLVNHYGTTVVIILCVQYGYLLMLYFAAAGFNFAEFMRLVHNAVPSYITGFGTMSSNATIPVTLESAQKNVGNRSVVELAVPIMANVHLVGDGISTPIISLMTLVIFQGYLPSWDIFLTFISYFCLSMFAVAGIPGGVILIVIPLLVSQLHCTSEMVSIITTLCLILDSFSTAANVMGDGALIVLFNKLLKRLNLVGNPSKPDVIEQPL